MDEVIYLDCNATTPLDPQVFAAMQPFFLSDFANAASRHAPGRAVATAVDRAREQVATVLGADSREIYWTSGATESNNLALLGTAAAKAYEKRCHLVTVRTEHRAVLDPCAQLEERGYEVTRLPVDSNGRIDLAQIKAALRPDTLLVSVMHGNNETGVLQPIGEIGALCREHRVLFHTDAAQTFGKESLDVEQQCIDLLSFTAHKLHGPKGVGGLFARRRGPRVRCEPLIHGGGHERGLRSGTLNVPGIVGLGAAAELAAQDCANEQSRIGALRDRLQEGLLRAIPGAVVHSAEAQRLATTLNMSFPGVDAQELLQSVPGIAASTASACTSATLQPSYVLGAHGLDDQWIRGSVRFSLGRFTTEEQIDLALGLLIAELG